MCTRTALVSLLAALHLMLPTEARPQGSFEEFPSWSLDTQASFFSIALGDVDGDGDLDFICGAALFRNLGTTFETIPAWTASSGDVRSVALGDVDGDGDLDLVCGIYKESTRLYRNSGTTFETLPAWSSSRQDSTTSVALGDVDGDGHLDLVCGNDAQNTTLYRNLGTTFETDPSWSSERPDRTQSVVLGDVDGDGDLDLVCGNNEQSTTLYRNTGTSFETNPFWSSERQDQTRSVDLGDVDGDGDLDLVVGNLALGNMLYLNLGTTFSPTPRWTSVQQQDQTNSVALGDVDGDGDLDLVCGNGYSNNPQSMTFFRNLGGSFESTPAWSSGRPTVTQSVALGDIDGDGSLDLVSGDGTLYRNLGTTFQNSPAWSGQSMTTMDIALGDIDGDGDPDLVCGNEGESTTLYRNTGTTFEIVPSWSSETMDSTTSVALGDVDGDGDLDLVCGNYGQSTKLYRNLGTTFETVPAWSSEPKEFTKSVALGDVDGDGDLDLVCGNSGSATLYRNMGTTFETVPSWSSGPQVSADGMALGDVDGDGDLDLVCSHLGRAALFRNLGTTFETDPDWSSERQDPISSVTLGDVDGDGDLDLVCGILGFGLFRNAHLYRNLGTTFETVPAWSSVRLDQTLSVALGDIDGDSDLDLICGNVNQSTTLYRNLGTTFEILPSWSSPLSENTQSVVLGDVDGDGDLDLVCGNSFIRSTMYRATARPPFRGEDPSNPTNQLPNSPAYLRWVRVQKQAPNLLRIRFTAIDVESDPVWVVADYGFRGAPTWTPILDANTSLGPLEASPNGNEYEFGWDILHFPPDRKEAVLRLRAISVPQQGGIIQFASAYVKELGRVVPFRPEIQPLNPSLDFQGVVTQGDTTSLDLEIRNAGLDTLRIKGFTPPPMIRVEQSVPILLLPGQSRAVPVYLEPTHGVEILGTADIQSNDPLTPTLSLEIHADIRALRAHSRLLAPAGQVRLGDALTVLVTPEPDVHVEGGALHYTIPGPMGGSYIDSLSSSAGEFLAVIPGKHVTEAGLEYSIEILNDPVVAWDPAPDSTYSVSVPHPDSLASLRAEPNSGGRYLENREIKVLVELQRGTVAESVLVHYRKGGESNYLKGIGEVGSSVIAVPIPADQAGPGGVEYWVEVQTINNTFTDPRDEPQKFPHVVPVTVLDLHEPAMARGGRYRMISVPLDFGAEFSGTLESFLSDQAAFGSYDPVRWKAFRWLPPKGESKGENRAWAKDDSVHWVKPGKAFWLIAREPNRVETAPIAGTSTPTNEPYAITLEPGWNQFGNPFAFPVAWSSVVRSDSLIGDPVAWEPDCGNIGDYVPCGQHPPFAAPDTLIPFKGYFIENKSTEPQTLWVPPVGVPTSLPVPTSVGKPPKPVPDIYTLDSWAMRLQARTDKAIDGSNVLGVAPGARDGHDRLDRGKPPAAPGPWVRVAFSHEDWGAFSGLYQRDLRQASSEGHVWNLEVRSAQAAQELTLELICAAAPPKDLAIQLVDRELNASQEILAPEGETVPYRLVSFGSEHPYRLTLIAGTETYVEQEEAAQRTLPARVELDQNVPNPFNAVTRIRFGLPGPGRVTLSVYNVRGERVAVLRMGEALPAGYHSSLWTGTDDRARPVGSGVYFCRLEVNATVLTQRLVLLK